MSDKVVKETIAARPFNINISIDSKRPEIHDRSRGIEGSLERVVKGIGNVVAARDAAGLNFHSHQAGGSPAQFRYLPEMVPGYRRSVEP